MQIKEKPKKDLKEEKITSEKLNELFQGKSLAPFFGINKDEVDGLTYQKKVRDEWK